MKKWIACLALVSLCFSVAFAEDDRLALLQERETLLRAMRPYSTRLQGQARQAVEQALLSESPIPAQSPQVQSTPSSTVPEAQEAANTVTPEPLDLQAWEALANELANATPSTTEPPVKETALVHSYLRVQALDEALYALDVQAGALPEKIVYLTQDDGPGWKTHALLDVLAQYDVRATFFLVGECVDRKPYLVSDIIAEGHVLANHSQTHDRENLRADFLKELHGMENSVAKALGAPVPIPILRVPYGNPMLGSQMLERLNAMGYLWIDWNVSNGDAVREPVPDQRIVSTATSAIGKYDRVVLLIHENKDQTVRTLPKIIERYLEAGYIFMPLTPNIQMIDGVPMGLPVQP